MHTTQIQYFMNLFLNRKNSVKIMKRRVNMKKLSQLNLTRTYMFNMKSFFNFENELAKVSMISFCLSVFTFFNTKSLI